MLFFQKMGRVVKKMIKVRTKNSDESRNESILSKRKLDYRYSGFSASASRPPIASPDLEENIGVKKDESPNGANHCGFFMFQKCICKIHQTTKEEEKPR